MRGPPPGASRPNGWIDTSVTRSARQAVGPRLADLLEDALQIDRDRPLGIVIFRFREIADVADVIALAAPIGVLIARAATAHALGYLERLEDRAAVRSPAADVVDLALTGP